MGPIAHILLFLLSASVIWLMSGLLIDATDRVAKRYKKPGFAVAFIVLGLLTSISEISVAVNATLEGVPQVSAGNLLGASLVIFLLIIPLLAVAGGGIPVSAAVDRRVITLLLTVVFLPTLIAADGHIDRTEGLVLMLLYCCVLYAFHSSRPAENVATKALKQTEEVLMHHHKATIIDAIKILVGATLIFVAGNILVDESILFAQMLGIPVSIVGMVLLSVGTNIPELVIAMRGILGGHKDIAFGDYMGSAAANTLVFALLSLMNGGFHIVRSEALLIALVFLPGLVCFWMFTRSQKTLTRKEGSVLLAFYVLFLATQVGNAVYLNGAEDPLRSGPNLEAQ